MLLGYVTQILLLFFFGVSVSVASGTAMGSLRSLSVLTGYMEEEKYRVIISTGIFRKISERLVCMLRVFLLKISSSDT